MDISKILKNKPKGTKLYSPIFGKATFLYVDCLDYIHVENEYNSSNVSFFGDGAFSKVGECLLFPSEEMRDWSKFAWKRGDVLVSKDHNKEIIFNGWCDDSYTRFRGKHYLNSEDENNLIYKKRMICCTDDFTIEEKDAAQCYLNTIKERLGGKLEKTDFKNGDVAYADYGNRQSVFIVSDKTTLSEGYNSFISLDLKDLSLNIGYRMCFFKKDLCKLRLATEEEKQQLFDALERGYKCWNAETKQIEPIKPEWTPKPFDNVLVRNYYNETWKCDFFCYKVGNKFHCMMGSYKQCIPYNEETAKLIGTK